MKEPFVGWKSTHLYTLTNSSGFISISVTATFRHFPHPCHPSRSQIRRPGEEMKQLVFKVETAKNKDNLPQEEMLQPPLSNRENQMTKLSRSAGTRTGLSRYTNKIASLGILLHSLGRSEQSRRHKYSQRVSARKCDIVLENCLLARTWRQSCCSR